MRKQKAVFIILLALTLVYPLIVYFSAQAYNAERAVILERLPEEFRPYIETNPFILSHFGALLMIFGASITASWFILFLWRK